MNKNNNNNNIIIWTMRFTNPTLKTLAPIPSFYFATKPSLLRSYIRSEKDRPLPPSSPSPPLSPPLDVAGATADVTSAGVIDVEKGLPVTTSLGPSGLAPPPSPPLVLLAGKGGPEDELHDQVEEPLEEEGVTAVLVDAALPPAPPSSSSSSGKEPPPAPAVGSGGSLLLLLALILVVGIAALVIGVSVAGAAVDDVVVEVGKRRRHLWSALGRIHSSSQT